MSNKQVARVILQYDDGGYTVYDTQTATVLKTAYKRLAVKTDALGATGYLLGRDISEDTTHIVLEMAWVGPALGEDVDPATDGPVKSRARTPPKHTASEVVASVSLADSRVARVLASRRALREA